MAVNVNIEDDFKVRITDPREDIKVTVKGPKTKVLEYKLNLRRAINGDLMIFDHQDIDIVILTEKKKVVAFAKDIITDAVYGASKRLFDHLRKQGVISYDSIEGGNIYGSLQGMLLESKEVDVLKITLFEISNWMQKEEPYFDNSYEEDINDELLNPDIDNSTELGEVPHEDQKGSIRQHNLFAPYLYGRYTY